MPLTLDEYDALPPEESDHHEIANGILIAVPRPPREHQQALAELAISVDRQVPMGWECVIAFEVVVRAGDPLVLRVPDLVVVPTGGPQQRVPATDVRLAVEILSDETRAIDLHVKASEYAEAGIPHYWVVDLDPPAPTITVFGLGAPGDGYRESQTATGELVVSEPFPLRIDIDALVDPEY
jgi:Uma2 family endonuclease